jgi:hypothetical protein
MDEAPADAQLEAAASVRADRRAAFRRYGIKLGLLAGVLSGLCFAPVRNMPEGSVWLALGAVGMFVVPTIAVMAAIFMSMSRYGLLPLRCVLVGLACLGFTIIGWLAVVAIVAIIAGP